MQAAPLHREALGADARGRYIGAGHLSRNAVDLRYEHDLGAERLQHPGALSAVAG